MQNNNLKTENRNQKKEEKGKEKDLQEKNTGNKNKQSNVTVWKKCEMQIEMCVCAVMCVLVSVVIK